MFADAAAVHTHVISTRLAEIPSRRVEFIRRPTDRFAT